MITLTANISGGTAPITYEWNYSTNIFTLTSTVNGGQTINLDINPDFINEDINTVITVTATDANGCVSTFPYTYIRNSEGCDVEIININFEVDQGNGDLIFTPVLMNPGNVPLNYQWALTSQYGTIIDENGQLRVRYNFPPNTNIDTTDEISLIVTNTEDTSCTSTASVNCSFQINITYSGGQPVVNYTMSCGNNGNPPIASGNIQFAINPVNQTVINQVTGVFCTDTEDGTIPVQYFYSREDLGFNPNESLLTLIPNPNTFSLDAPGDYYVYTLCEDSDGNKVWTGPEILTVDPLATVGNAIVEVDAVDLTFNSGEGVELQIGVTSDNPNIEIDEEETTIFARFYSGTTAVSDVLSMKLNQNDGIGQQPIFRFNDIDAENVYPTIPIDNLIVTTAVVSRNISNPGIIQANSVRMEVPQSSFSFSPNMDNLAPVALSNNSNNNFLEAWEYPPFKTEISSNITNSIQTVFNTKSLVVENQAGSQLIEFNFPDFVPTPGIDYEIAFEVLDANGNFANPGTYTVLQLAGGTNVLTTGNFTKANTNKNVFNGQMIRFTAVDNSTLYFRLQTFFFNPTDMYIGNITINQA